MADVTTGALVDYLTDADVADETGTLDAYRLAQWQQVIELLPHFQDTELARQPAPKPKVVFTLPPGVKLPARAVDLGRRTLAVRVLSALGSAADRCSPPLRRPTGCRVRMPRPERPDAVDDVALDVGRGQCCPAQRTHPAQSAPFGDAGQDSQVAVEAMCSSGRGADVERVLAQVR